MTLRADIRAALLDTDWRRQIDEAQAGLAALEPYAVTARWMAGFHAPLDEDPPEWENPFTHELMIEGWAARAARILTYRMWKLEEQNAPKTVASARNAVLPGLPGRDAPLGQTSLHSPGLAADAAAAL